MSTRNRVLLDVALFAAIVLAYAPAVTGISLHEWLGVAIIVPSLFHLVLNWEWVVRIAKNVFAKLTATTWAHCTEGGWPTYFRAGSSASTTPGPAR